MMTLLLLVVAALAVVAAGEAVRTQCRRMLSRPLVVQDLAAPRTAGETIEV
jgi:hypothetical protein